MTQNMTKTNRKPKASAGSLERMVRPLPPDHMTPEGKDLRQRGYRGHDQAITLEMRSAYGLAPA